MSNLPFGFDAPEDSPGFLLWQTTMLWQRQIKKALEPYEISHAQFVIMAALLWLHGKHQDVTQVDIVNMSKLDKMTVSKSLKKLVGMRLVERQESQEDTRAKQVKLTKSGVGMARQLVPIVEGIDAVFFGQLLKNQETNLVSILRKLSQGERSS